MTFPQIIVGEELVGGYTEVVAAANSGRLDQLLAA
jgi:glutaredoxin-related protein